MENEEIAKGIGAAFATTFFEVIKDEPPKKFSWEKFFDDNKGYVKEKLPLYFMKEPDNLEDLRKVAEYAFQEAINVLKSKHPTYPNKE